MRTRHVLRIRDALRNFFIKFCASGPKPTRLPPSSTPEYKPVLPADPGAKVLAQALSSLEPEERATIERYVVHGATNINTAITQAYGAALAHKEKCEAEKWRWSFRGHPLELQKKAENVMCWLDRLKAIGDVVANADPIHIGLPWAGIRMVLEVGGADRRQMAALLVGMDLAMVMACRLQAYSKYLSSLSTDLPTENFEKALQQMYVLLLRFIATAIQTYEAGLLTRVVSAIWQTPSLEKFEAECDKLAQRAQIEASICDRHMHRQQWEYVRSSFHELKGMLSSIDEISKVNRSLQVKIDLSRLVTAPAALYNSSSQTDDEIVLCLEKTRGQLLLRIDGWADDADGRCIFWLCGKAGHGKSTIARTVADRLDKQHRLAASFFFKRGEGDRGNANRFFPTIVNQLVDMIPDLGPHVAKALGEDSFLSSKGLQDQFDKLLYQPMVTLSQSQSIPSETFVVIDALDECDPGASIKTILFLLARIDALSSVRLRIFVTSRPELPIHLGFHNISSTLYQNMVLEEVQNTSIKHDIRLFFQARLKEIQKEDSLTQPYDPLPVDWPGDDRITALVDLAAPLFIFAATICRFLEESDPQERLELVLRPGQNMSLSGIEKTYLPILNHLTANKSPQQETQIISEFKELIGPIVLLADPLSIPSLSRLLGIPSRTIGERLVKLRSVLNIPADQDAPIRLLHLSFRDFLTDLDTTNQNRFWIDETKTHRILMQKCLLLLQQPGKLKEDICDVKRPGCRRYSISQAQIADSITPDVVYACSYWVWHLAHSDMLISDDSEVHIFLEACFLYWMEALSWLGRLSELIAHLDTIESLVNVSCVTILNGKCSENANRPEIEAAGNTFAQFSQGCCTVRAPQSACC